MRKRQLKKTFLKLMNNANFGNDCRNNASNVTFESIIDEINEISYIKKYYSTFDTKVSFFINRDLLEQETEQIFQQHLVEVKYDDPFRNARIAAIENQNKEESDGLEALKKKERKPRRRKRIRDVEAKLEGAFKNKKIKTMIDFDGKECNSIKSIPLKGNIKVNVTARFSDRKMLMFAKILLKSFVYNMIDVFCSPTEEVKMIYNKYDIVKCHLYLNLTDTGSCLCFFNFICKKECNIKESKSRNLIFEILKQ